MASLFLVTGSKVKVNFGTLCLRSCTHDTELHMYVVDDDGRNLIRSNVKVKIGTLCGPCGHNTDYSFCPITFNFHMLVFAMRGRTVIGFVSLGQRSPLALCLLNFLDTIQTTIVARSLSNFSCKLLMMRGKTY